MKKKILRIATRKSTLALWQAEFVKQKFLTLHPTFSVELIPLSTKGDEVLNTSLAKIGGKGLFTKELEEALLDDRADIAVHSMKDVPAEFPEGLGLAAICEREDPRDVFVSYHYKSLSELPPAARVGTSSLRRSAQLLARFPQCKIEVLRGNVESRIKRLEEGKFEGILLAYAGLKRLNLTHHIKEILPLEDFLPAVGQGALGIECLRDNRELWDLLAPLNHPQTVACVTAERSMNKALQGSCNVPIGGFAEIHDDSLLLKGLVATPTGTILLKAQASGKISSAQTIGTTVAKDLLDQGAGKILAECAHDLS